MAKLRSFDAIKALKQSAQLMEGIDNIPDDIQSAVVPVIDITPRKHRSCNIVKGAQAINATTSTIYTSPTDQDFFLVGGTLSVIKDATATSTSSRITAVVDGLTVIVAIISELTLTAQTGQLSFNLPYPIKVDRGSVIAVTNSTNVGNVTSGGSIWGYTVSNPQG